MELEAVEEVSPSQEVVTVATPGADTFPGVGSSSVELRLIMALKHPEAPRTFNTFSTKQSQNRPAARFWMLGSRS